MVSTKDLPRCLPGRDRGDWSILMSRSGVQGKLLEPTGPHVTET